MSSPPQVQPYALVLVADRKSFAIKAASRQGAERCGLDPDQLRRQTLNELFGPEVVSEIVQTLSEDFPAVVALPEGHDFGEEKHQVIAHSLPDEIVIEVEPRRTWPHSGDYAARMNDFSHELESGKTKEELLQTLCDGLLYHFGYDRAAVVQFDDKRHGIVTHEARIEGLSSLLNVRYIEADMPQKSRRSLLRESVLNFTTSESNLDSVEGKISDRAEKVIRYALAAREPVRHTASYLRKTGQRTLATLSLIVDNDLWGTLYLHSREPLYLDYQMRAFMRVMGRVAQQKIAFHVSHNALRMSQESNKVRDTLYEELLRANSLTQGLVGGETTALDLLPNSGGVAVCSDGELALFGNTPSRSETNGLFGWLKQEVGIDRLWYTDNLLARYTNHDHLAAAAAGMLFLPLAPHADQWIIWFKPESVRTLTYGSRNLGEDEGGERDYELYDEVCYQCSEPWTDDEIGTAQAMQSYVQTMVAERYAESRRRNALLRKAIEDLEVFSYTISHDLRTPLRGIAGYAEAIREDYEEVLGEEGRAQLRVIEQSADRMRAFMDDLLALSRADRTNLVINCYGVADLVEQVLKDLSTVSYDTTLCEVQADLPEVCGDFNQMVVVFSNLLSNAFKYSAEHDRPRIRVGWTGEYRKHSPVFFVEDNGIGMPAEEQQRVFDLFARLSNSGNFRGTGIGLALVHRIISHHGGEVWIESEEGRGTRVLFYTGATPD